MSRREHALTCIDLAKGRGLELGPLHSPIVSKKEAKVFYVDHMTTEELRAKYKGHPFDLDTIAPVDYALHDKSLHDTVGNKKFDYVIASHVIEHIPDTVRWLQDVALVLKEGGILSLVIPDKRFTFDIDRNVSRPADVIGAYLDKHTRASSATMYDFIVSVRDVEPSDVWREPHKDHITGKPSNSPQKAMENCQQNLLPDVYVDSHIFVYTPFSFFEVLRSLIIHNLLDYEVADFCTTPENELEFYVSLRKRSKPVRSKQLRTLPKLLPAQKRWELETEIDRLQQELHNLTHSKSWQVTKPLRTVLSKVNKRSRN